MNDTEFFDFRRPELSTPAAPARHVTIVFPWSSLIWGLVALAALVIVLVTLPGVVEEVGFAVRRGPERAAADAARQALSEYDASKLDRGFQLAVRAVNPSVVLINTRRVINGQTSDELSQFFGPPRRQKFEARGQGSGVIVDPAGYIVTNFHVVQGANEITVVLSDGARKPARRIGADALTDLAVLKIDAEKLTVAPWGNSDALEVGSWVLALGSPFGLDHSVTSGIVSAKGRDGVTGSPFQSFLQTDAAVNPGNSGGPLINIKGEVVGINTAIVGESYQGVSFALPSSTARKVYESLRERGSIERGWLGVGLDQITAERAERLGLKDAAGALVTLVVAQSPAAEAGVQVGDVLTAWNGHAIDGPTTISRLVAQAAIGSAAKLAIVRGGQAMTLTVTVRARPANL